MKEILPAGTKGFRVAVSALAMLAMGALSASASTVYVKANSPAPTAPYDSWANACGDIATAVSYAAANGADTVLVTNGTYNVSSTIVLNSAITLRSVEGAAQTTIDGQNQTRVLEVYNGALVTGFTVANGATSYSDGAGIKINGGAVEQCVVTGCTVTEACGGGIYVENGRVEGCVVTGCFATANDGGGGGGIYVNNGTVRSCLIAGNECTGGQGHIGGGGIYVYNSSTVENCTIVRNYDHSTGNSNDGAGGLYVRDGSSPAIRNCIIRDNDADVPAWATRDNHEWFVYSNSSPTGSHNNLPTGLEFGTDAVTGDPLFVNAGSGYGLTAVLGDYHIPLASPCARAASAQAWMDTAVDADGQPRKASPTSLPDLGAYTVISSSFACDFSVSPSRGAAPLTVSFVAMVDVPGSGDAQLTYHWDFDNDGTYETEGTESSASWTYEDVGTFSPRLRVENGVDSSWCQSIATDGVIVSPSTIYVSPNGSETAPYATLQTATHSIATALAVAADGITISIDSGVYPLDATLEITDGVTLVSYDKANPAVLDGQGAIRCVTVSHANAVLDGLVISNGYSNVSEYKGCGVLLSNGTIRDCTITACEGDNGAWGAGIYANGGLIYRSRIVGNSTTGQMSAGGGVCLEGQATLRGCLVTGNYCSGTQGHLGGGGVFLYSGGRVENCTIVGNTDNANWGSDGAGGLYMFNAPGTSYVTNTIISGNYIETGSGAEWYDRMGNPSNPTYVAGFNCTTPSFGSDCVTEAPIFTDAENGDYSLDTSSPGAFQGENLAWMVGETDIAGNPRIDANVGRADIGAYACVASGNTLVCEYNVSYTLHTAPVVVTFTGRAIGTAVGSLTYYWDFDGDGVTDQSGSDCANTSFTYTTPGIFSPVLVVTNSSPFAEATAVVSDCVTIPATAVYVATNGGSIPPYDSAQKAATTLAAAMSFVGAGTESINIAAGHYYVSEPIVLSGATTLHGAGAETTIIDGGNLSRVLELNNAGAVCEGVSLVNGRTQNDNGGAGAMLYAGTLRDCVVSNCYANSAHDGQSGGGGVMFSNGSSALMERCKIVNNTASSVGGGVFIYNTGTLRNCLIAANECGGGQGHVGGGGVSAYYGGATLDCCTIVGNYDGGYGEGGGFYLFFNNVTLSNCLLYANKRADADIDIYNWTGNATGTIVDHCFVGISYGDALTGDPLLKNVGGYATAGLNYNYADCHLDGNSPCISKGTLLSWMTASAIDLDGNKRVVGTPDIGCYEFRVRGTVFLLR